MSGRDEGVILRGLEPLTFATATLWIGLGLVATLAARRLRISSALTEIVVGIAAAAIAARVAGPEALGSRLPWLTFLASTGSAERALALARARLAAGSGAVKAELEGIDGLRRRAESLIDGRAGRQVS